MADRDKQIPKVSDSRRLLSFFRGLQDSKEFYS